MRNSSCEWLPTPMPSGFDRVRPAKFSKVLMDDESGEPARMVKSMLKDGTII